MIPRALADRLKKLANSYPVLFLTGPRQSGKTTLARATFPGFIYNSLENIQIREEALEDPRGFLKRFEKKGGVILDEVQRTPDLFSYLQGFVDDQRGGPFVLTGSQHFLLSEKVSQSLAGRAAVLELLPFSLSELLRRKPIDRDQLEDLDRIDRQSPGVSLDEVLVKGFYPRIHHEDIEAEDWLGSYLTTYVERDIRMLSNVANLDTFSRFVALCAGRSGQLVNTNSLGADLGVSHHTVRRWLSLLRTSYIITILAPHHNNLTKRIVKTPKLYFLDTGLLCHLIGIRNKNHLVHHPLRGAIFETFVVGEFIKVFYNQAHRAPLFFWRDTSGREIDLVIDFGSRMLPVEIKAGQTISADFFKNLDYYTTLAKESGGILVYGGDDNYYRKQHQVRAWWACS